MGLSLHQHGHSHGHTHGHGHGHGNGSHKTNQSPDHDKIDVESVSNDKKNINVRAAFIHVVGDFIQSVGVLIAALVIYFKVQ